MTPKFCGGFPQPCRPRSEDSAATVEGGVDGWRTTYAKPAEQVVQRRRQDNHRFPSKKI